MADKQHAQGGLTRRYVGTKLINLGLAPTAHCRSATTRERSRDGCELPQSSRQVHVGPFLCRVVGRVVSVSVKDRGGWVYDGHSLVEMQLCLFADDWPTKRTPPALFLDCGYLLGIVSRMIRHCRNQRSSCCPACMSRLLPIPTSWTEFVESRDRLTLRPWERPAFQV